MTHPVVAQLYDPTVYAGTHTTGYKGIQRVAPAFVETPTRPQPLPETTAATNGPSPPHTTRDANTQTGACGGSLTVAFGNDGFRVGAAMSHMYA